MPAHIVLTINLLTKHINNRVPWDWSSHRPDCMVCAFAYGVNEDNVVQWGNEATAERGSSPNRPAESGLLG